MLTNFTRGSSARRRCRISTERSVESSLTKIASKSCSSGANTACSARTIDSRLASSLRNEKTTETVGCFAPVTSRRSDVAVLRVADHSEALDEFGDPHVEHVLRPPAGRLDLGVGDDVVALVRVLADRGFERHEAG